MKKFFLKYKIIFYSINILLVVLYLFPGSLIGWILYDDKKIQPQITPDFLISSNHFYVFIIITIIGLISFKETKEIKFLFIYLISLSIFLEIFHIIIPERSFQWSDLFGNFFGVVVVIFINNLINKYEIFK